MSQSEGVGFPQDFAEKVQELVSAYLVGRESLDAAARRLAKLLMPLNRPGLPPGWASATARLTHHSEEDRDADLEAQLGNAENPFDGLTRTFTETYVHTDAGFPPPPGIAAVAEKIRVLLAEATRLVREGLEE